MGGSQSSSKDEHTSTPSPAEPCKHCHATPSTQPTRPETKPSTASYTTRAQHTTSQANKTQDSQVEYRSGPTKTAFAPVKQPIIYASALRSTNISASQPTSQGSSSSSSKHQVQLEAPCPASQNVRHSASNYVIPAVEATERKYPRDIAPCQDRRLTKQRLRACPQYNGRGCVAQPCRRLHVCFYWATKTCNKSFCKLDHCLDSVHNTRLIEVSGVRLDDHVVKSFYHEEPQICLYSVLKKCTKDPCTRVHSFKNYIWEVQDTTGWIQLPYNQSDYLELMYCHPSEECVDLIPLQTRLANNRNLQRLARLLAKETKWSVDLETFKLKGNSSVHNIRRLSTPSDLTSSLPVATRWLWYWQDNEGYWQPYGEGFDKRNYYVALSDHLEFILRVQNKGDASIDIGKNYSYYINGTAMTQTNIGYGKCTRKVRRRPACSLVRWNSVKFDELFLTQPTTKKFLKLPVAPLSSEFLFVEKLLTQSLAELNIASIHRVQNDHLWKVYQNKKRLLVSLYNGDKTAINEQYLFHSTSPQAVDCICQDNLDWKLWGTNIGHSYGQGTYFSNLAQKASSYARGDRSGKKVMLVVLVLVGKMTQGHRNMSFPPMNVSTGRNYDTTCDKGTNANIFVKYDRDEYYPAYVVTYNCGSPQLERD